MNIIQQFQDANGNNIYPIAYAQGGMKMDLLWTNPSPAASFAAQTVSLDLSNYNFLIIYCLNGAGGSDGSSFTLLKDLQHLLCITPTSSSFRYRIATASNSGVTFSGGYIGGSGNDVSIVPYQIYGIKMSYIVPTSVHGLQYVEVE